MHKTQINITIRLFKLKIIPFSFIFPQNAIFPLKFYENSFRYLINILYSLLTSSLEMYSWEN